MGIGSKRTAKKQRILKKPIAEENELYRELIENGPESHAELLEPRDTEFVEDEANLYKEIRDQELKEGAV